MVLPVGPESPRRGTRVATCGAGGPHPGRRPLAMSESVVRTRRWSRVEYDKLIEEGVFQAGERLELLAGQLVVREPQGTPHATGIRLVTRALREVFADDTWIVDMQLPVAL